MKKSTIYKVKYTKRIGGEGSVLVKSNNAENAIKCARQHVFTGRDFRDAEGTNEVYTTPYKQGFMHS
jgi:hypothetical protein